MWDSLAAALHKVVEGDKRKAMKDEEEK